MGRKSKNTMFLARIFARKPRFFARALANYSRAAFLGQHRLRFMDIAVDYTCNLSCSHCSAMSLRQRDQPRLSVDEYRRISAELRHHGCLLFHFTGGEPLLRNDLEDIIRVFDPASSAISLQSNGFPATRKRLEALKKAGLDIFCVSLDSGIREEHDKFRNCQGSFDKALEALILARDIGLITTISTCVSHDNVYSDGLHKVIDLAAELTIDCQFNLAVPAGRWREQLAFVLTDDDKRQVRILLRENPHCRLDLFHNWSKVGCGAIKEKLYLSAYGDIMPCPFIQVSFGNLRQDGVSTARQRAMAVSEFREYWPECLAAEVKPFMEQLANFYEGAEGMPVPFDAARWQATGKPMQPLKIDSQ